MLHYFFLPFLPFIQTLPYTSFVSFKFMVSPCIKCCMHLYMNKCTYILPNITWLVCIMLVLCMFSGHAIFSWITSLCILSWARLFHSLLLFLSSLCIFVLNWSLVVVPLSILACLLFSLFIHVYAVILVIPWM